MANKKSEATTKKKKLPPGVRERNGRFTYRYSVEVVANGKATRKQKETKSYPTAEEAYAAGILIEADRLKGKNIDPTSITLGQWSTQWTDDYAMERDPKKATLRSRKQALRSLKKFIGENELLRNITLRMYRGWLNDLKKRGRKKTTLTMYHSAAKLMFEAAVREKLLDESPAKNVSVPAYRKTLEQVEKENPLPRYLEKDELKHFLRIVRFRAVPQMYNLFALLAYTGMRIGEALALKLSDFDESAGTIAVRRTLDSSGKTVAYSVDTPKTKSSIRTIVVGKTVIRAVKAQIAWREQEAQNHGLQLEEEFLFWSPTMPGYPMLYSRAYYQFCALVELAGLPESITPHTLRHTHVSLLAEAGEDLAVIQERLGHRDDRVTRLIYTHVTRQRKALAADRFESVMGG